MKILIPSLAILLAAMPAAFGQAGTAYVNLLRQVQINTDLPPELWVKWDVQVPDEGQQLSPLAIDPGGARFELWTLLDDVLLSSHLLDTKYVSTYTPVADLVVITEDPYKVIPRTRADRSFDVVIKTDGLSQAEDAHEAAKKVHVMRHVQSYGIDGNTDTIDRSQATLLQEVYLTDNKTHHFTFPINAIPGEDRTKVRGEERFSIYTIDDYQAPPSQIASMYVQVWPMARGAISGLNNGQLVRFDTPSVTVTLEDLYPDSRTYAQLYPGAPALGTDGNVIPGSGLVIYEAVPHNRTLVLENWDSMIDKDGQWTIEVLTVTPFGIDRLAHVSFTVNRSIEVQSTVTTLD